MFIKIMRLLLKIEKIVLNFSTRNKDTVVYEDYLYAIKNHQKEIERIYKESKM